MSILVLVWRLSCFLYSFLLVFCLLNACIIFAGNVLGCGPKDSNKMYKSSNDNTILTNDISCSV